MQTLNSIYQSAQNYYQEIPANTGKEMLYSFAAGYIIETIFTGKPSKGVIAGALSALATTIYGLVTPLFKELVGNRRPLTWGEEMCRTFTAIIGAGCVASAFVNTSILNKLGALAIIFGLSTYFNPARRDLHSTHWIVIFPNYSQPAVAG